MHTKVSIHAGIQPRSRGITAAHPLLRRFPVITPVTRVNPTRCTQYGLARWNLLSYNEIEGITTEICQVNDIERSVEQNFFFAVCQTRLR